MTKRFCDFCGAELCAANHFNNPTEIPTKGKKQAPLMVQITDKVDVCKYCVIDSFMDIDDRPKAG